MKKILGCLITLVILSLCVVPSFAQAPTVSVGANTTKVSVGDTISVSVNVSAESNLTMVRFNVNYQMSHFELVSGSARAAGVFGTTEINESNGSISYFGASDEAVVSGGTILTIQFKVLQGGGTIYIVGLTSTGPESAVSRSLAFQQCAHGNISWETVKASTCAEAGIKKGTCPCGETKEEALPKAEHKFDKFETTAEPTCTGTGTQVAKCTVCNATGPSSSIPAAGHKFDDSAIKKQPTCTQTGSAVGKCNVCGFESDSPVTIPAKGHSFAAWVTTKEPTLLMEGEESRACSVCNHVETRKVKKLTTTPDEEVIEPSTSNPIEIPTQPIEPNTQQQIIDNNNNYKPNNDKDKDDDKDDSTGLFGSELTDSDKSAILVIVLAVVTVVALTIYILLLQQRKKKE